MQGSLFDVRPTGKGAYGQAVDDPPPVAKPSRTITDGEKVDVKAEKAKRKAQKAALLAALRKGPLTNNEIIEFAQHVSGRVYDLRKSGFDIETKFIRSGEYLYILHEPPREGVNGSALPQ